MAATGAADRDLLAAGEAAAGPAPKQRRFVHGMFVGDGGNLELRARHVAEDSAAERD